VVRELYPNIDPIWRVRVNGKWQHPHTVKGQTYCLDPDTSHVEEFANSLTQVECKWVEIFTEHDTTQHALLHSSTRITTAHTTLRGSITLNKKTATRQIAQRQSMYVACVTRRNPTCNVLVPMPAAPVQPTVYAPNFMVTLRGYAHTVAYLHPPPTIPQHII
jgi:hypothetical protein